MSKIDEFGAFSVMLAGDFHVHHEEWLDSRNTDAAGRLMHQFVNSHGLNKIVKEPTRGDQVLDLVLTDLPSSSSTLGNLGTSDHNPVLFNVDAHPFGDKPYKRKVWQYDQADFWEMRIPTFYP